MKKIKKQGENESDLHYLLNVIIITSYTREVSIYKFYHRLHITKYGMSSVDYKFPNDSLLWRMELFEDGWLLCEILLIFWKFDMLLCDVLFVEEFKTRILLCSMLLLLLSIWKMFVEELIVGIWLCERLLMVVDILHRSK